MVEQLFLSMLEAVAVQVPLAVMHLLTIMVLVALAIMQALNGVL